MIQGSHLKPCAMDFRFRQGDFGEEKLTRDDSNKQNVGQVQMTVETVKSDVMT